MYPSLFALLFSLLILTACQKDSIEIYQAPKEAPVVMPGAGGMSGMAALPGMEASPEMKSRIHWKTPKGWQEQPTSTMRVGSFLIKEGTGQADVSVVPLTGDAGGDLANVNRWRGQIGLPVQSADAFAKSSAMKMFGGHRMRWVDFANGGKRITAAIYKEGETSWFFKMMGDDSVVGREQRAFVAFLNSVDMAGHAH